jgi:hypothetical protein
MVNLYYNISRKVVKNMTKDQINNLAIEKTRELFPQLEVDNPSYFMELVRTATNTIVKDYDLNILGPESHVKELIELDLRNIQGV